MVPLEISLTLHQSLQKYIPSRVFVSFVTALWPKYWLTQKKDRPKSKPAKPVVVGGTMGFMSWLAEAKSNTETVEEEEVSASDEERAVEIVSKRIKEVTDQSPKVKQVCGFCTSLNQQQYQPRKRTSICFYLSQTKSRPNAIRLERNAATGTMGFTKWLQEAKSSTPAKRKTVQALNEAPLEMRSEYSDDAAEESDNAAEESDNAAEESDNAAEKSSTATQVKRCPFNSSTFP